MIMSIRSFLNVLALFQVVSSTTYSYTGGVQQYIVPSDGETITATVCGAGGGSCTNSGGKSPGYGGCITSTLTGLTRGMILYVYVGGLGSKATCDGCGGGYNGGGNGAIYRGSAKGGGGGGASDIRTTDSLFDRIMVGGAGGGCGYANSGGHGGQDTGGNARDGSPGGGYGGTQTAGGATYVSGTGEAGSFGAGGDAFLTDCNGGGGGGWYGGGGGGEGTTRYGGGGGSSYSCYDIVSNTQGEQSGAGEVFISPDSCSDCTETFVAVVSASCTYQTVAHPTTGPTRSPPTAYPTGVPTTTAGRTFLTFSNMHLDPGCTSEEYLGYTTTSSDAACLSVCQNNAQCDYAVWRPSDQWCHQCNLARSDPVVSASAAGGVAMTSYCFACSAESVSNGDDDDGDSSSKSGGGSPIVPILIGVFGGLFFVFAMYCYYKRRIGKVDPVTVTPVTASAAAQPAYIPVATVQSSTMYVGGGSGVVTYDPSGMELGTKTAHSAVKPAIGGENVMYLG